MHNHYQAPSHLRIIISPSHITYNCILVTRACHAHEKKKKMDLPSESHQVKNKAALCTENEEKDKVRKRVGTHIPKSRTYGKKQGHKRLILPSLDLFCSPYML